MSQGWFVRHHRWIVVLVLAVWAAGLASFVGIVVAYDIDFFGPVGGPWVFAVATFAVTGAVIAWQRPDNVLGRVFLVVGLSAPVANTLTALALGPFAEHDPGTRALFVGVAVAVTTAVVPLVPLTMTIFPDGRLPSPRWRWLPWGTAATSLVGASAAMVTGSWGGDPHQELVGPPFSGRLAEIGHAISPVFDAMFGVLLIAGTAALVVRYRRSDATVRQQVKWLAMAAVLLTVFTSMLLGFQFVTRGPMHEVGIVLTAFGIAFVPVAVTIAILRHRLYDIDLVLNRTIVFGMLAAFITALYVAVVVGIGTLIGDPSNIVLTVGATALVAVAFEPVRSRVQHWANLAVYGRRATPYEVLAAIAGEIGRTSHHASQLEAMAALLADGTGADHATVWIADEDGTLNAAACSPNHDASEHPAIDDVAAAPTRAGVHFAAVRHDDELLGALSFDRGRDDPVTPQERELVTELAGQASLVLANARLRARLRARLEQLRASRQRLVAAQDEARRRLERDLHDGAQQQLVALKVKLGLATTIATKEDAGDGVAATLQQISTLADRAVDSLRTLARGIYPPLLEAEGLARALATFAGSAPVQVESTMEGVGRYQRSVEATVYFCVLQAVRTAVEHGNATHARIFVTESGGQLSFDVSSDGWGERPEHAARRVATTDLRDRVEALGGTLEVTQAADGTVRVSGTMPVGEASDEIDTDMAAATH